MAPRFLVLIALVAAALQGLAETARGDDAKAAKRAKDEFSGKVQPFLKKYCFSCHAGGKSEGDVSLDVDRDVASVLSRRRTWTQVFERLKAHEMPPEGKTQPPAAEVDAVTAWIDRQLSDECAGPRNPGRVTMRRLNRAEYNSTIRDLVGVNFQPADDFPSDDVGYGFDNIGDVLSLPPLLLEKYLAAAERIMSAAIVSRPTEAVIGRAEAKKLRPNLPDSLIKKNRFRVLASNGELDMEAQFPVNGEYLFQARAYATQAGDEPAKMTLLIDGREVQTVDVKALEKSPQLYEVKARVEAGKHKFAVGFINDFYDPDNKDANRRDRNLVLQFLEISGPLQTDYEHLPEIHKRIIPHAPGEGDQRQYAVEILRRFASKAFRRPATAAEVDRLAALYEMAQKEGENFEESIKITLQAVLVSPHFLFRVELDPQPNDPQAIRLVSDYELASRLSYFLWSSMPDHELFNHARLGTLRKGNNFDEQVRRMMKDPKAQAFVENFAGQWLQLRNLKTIFPDQGKFPGFDEALRAAMRKESEMFFTAVMQDDLSVLTFLDADFTFVNGRLAKHYGMQGVKGAEFRRVSLTGEQRGGVLTQASVLTVTSNPTRTSPVKRGKWVLENLLGAPPPPPPPNVPDLKDDNKSALTGSLRERMEQHRSRAECASCHSRMDPLGFGLENFDGIGGWRTKEGNFEIDASGTLPSGKSFSGPRGLKQVLKGRQDEFVHCLSEKMLTYALGRGLEYYDKCVVDQIAAETKQGEYKFSALALSVVKSEAFQKRRAKGLDP